MPEVVTGLFYRGVDAPAAGKAATPGRWTTDAALAEAFARQGGVVLVARELRLVGEKFNPHHGGIQKGDIIDVVSTAGTGAKSLPSNSDTYVGVAVGEVVGYKRRRLILLGTAADGSPVVGLRTPGSARGTVRSMISAAEKHLPGKHQQKRHGRRGDTAALMAWDAANEPPNSYGDTKSWRQSFFQRHGQTTETTAFATAVSDWQDMQFPRMRKNAQRIAAGEKVDASTMILMRSVKTSPPIANEIHRGISVKQGPEFTKFMGEFEPGKSVDIGLSSFSSKKSVAAQFAKPSFKGSPEVPVMFRLSKGARALNVQPFSTDREIFGEAEMIVSGRFTVRSIREVSGSGIEVVLSQTGQFEV